MSRRGLTQRYAVALYLLREIAREHVAPAVSWTLSVRLSGCEAPDLRNAQTAVTALSWVEKRGGDRYLEGVQVLILGIRA